jgi:hypothetical protein
MSDYFLSDAELADAHRELESGTVIVKPDEEFNAETFWAALDNQFPNVARELRENGIVEISSELWGQLRGLEGFAGGPAHAPHALLTVDRG